MKFLALAYGAEKDWLALSPQKQEELLAQDEVLRQRGALVAMLGAPTTVRAWDGVPRTEAAPFAKSDAPLVGFGLIEARDLEEAVLLVAKTPCAVAGGAVTLLPLIEP